MDTKEYLQACQKICNDYEGEVLCDKCPLRKLGCGIPRESSEINTVIDIVEHYNAKQYPFGQCSNCGKEFNSEIISEYEAKFCPWCGTEINR